jgi:hypothetical protein
MAHVNGSKNLFEGIDYGNEVRFIKSDIRQLEMKSFDPFTHVFIFGHSYSDAAMKKSFDLINAR